MDGDDSGGPNDGFGSLMTALGRAKDEINVAVGHGVGAVENWVADRWFPIRLAVLGGFGWTTSQAFGWLLNLLVGVGRWLASELTGMTPASGKKILVSFFLVYVIHSLSQTKLILGIKTKMGRMDSGGRSEVRTDGGEDEFSHRGWAIGGILIGAILGTSFGTDGIFVGAGVGWVLGDELDRRFEAMVNEA